jgi:hypothetical protein
VRSHKQKVTVTETHQFVVRLPSDFPPGEAEVIVLSEAARPDEPKDLATWLEQWVAGLPPAPSIPLDAMGRDSIYR